MTGALITIALLVTLAGPIAFGAAGSFRGWRYWRLSALSAVAYALAFNIVFFIQELFLVLPKAASGLRPTLYHNNHRWEGDDPIAHLLPGTGALAILFLGCAFLAWLAFRRPRIALLRLLAIWIAFNGVYQSVPQVVLGSVFARNDVGMAMAYLGLGVGAKALAVLLALGVIVFVGMFLSKQMLGLAPAPEDISGAAARSRFMFNAAIAPALAALPIIMLSRAPGSWDQVALVPVAVTVIGAAWLQANAWRVSDEQASGAAAPRGLAIAAAALLTLIVVFHAVLRPGVQF